MACDVDESSSGSSTIVDADLSAPAPINTTESFSATLTGNTSLQKQITFTKEYCYFKMLVKNTGSYAIVVDLGNKTYTVPAKTNKYIYATSAWGAQTCTFGFATKTVGKAMKGSVTCYLTTTLEEATP
jgi:hypothetical protein